MDRGPIKTSKMTAWKIDPMPMDLEQFNGAWRGQKKRVCIWGAVTHCFLPFWLQMEYK